MGSTVTRYTCMFKSTGNVRKMQNNMNIEFEQARTEKNTKNKNQANN